VEPSGRDLSSKSVPGVASILRWSKWSLCNIAVDVSVMNFSLLFGWSSRGLVVLDC
jgi:hypothetical protein